MTGREVSLADAAVPVLAAAVITVGIAAHGDGDHLVAALVGGAAGLALLARHHTPALTLALTGFLAGVLLHLAPDAGVAAVIAPAVALYSLALRSGPRTKVGAATAAITAVVLADALHHGGPTLLQTLGHVLLVAIPLLVADLHRTRHANLRLLTERLALADNAREQEARQRVQQERLRIARDLHDVVAHTLTTINVQASTAAELLERNPTHARNALLTIEEASREAIGELRTVLGVLREGTEDTPMRPAPQIEDLPELIARARDDGVAIEYEVTGRPDLPVPDRVSLAAYRIVQESLTNARRHAAGADVDVRVDVSGSRVRLSIVNRRGHPHGDGNAAGVGIFGMRERAASLGGSLAARPTDEGFRVDADLPCPPA